MPVRTRINQSYDVRPIMLSMRLTSTSHRRNTRHSTRYLSNTCSSTTTTSCSLAILRPTPSATYKHTFTKNASAHKISTAWHASICSANPSLETTYTCSPLQNSWAVTSRRVTRSDSSEKEVRYPTHSRRDFLFSAVRQVLRSSPKKIFL